MLTKKTETERKETVYLTIDDVMQRLHICRTIAYNLVHTPGFPAIKVGRKFFIPEDRFDDFMRSYCGKELFIVNRWG